MRPEIVLEPSYSWFDQWSAFNPAVYQVEDKIFVLYRAISNPLKYKSRLGLAVFSSDLNLLYRSLDPVVDLDHSVEDPRARIGDKLLVSYVYVPNPRPPRKLRERLEIEWPQEYLARGGLLSGKSAESLRFAGFLGPDIYSRNYVLFPDGETLLFRPNVREYSSLRERDVWLQKDDDIEYLVQIPLSPWNVKKVGAGPPPIEVKRGWNRYWLLFFHGVDREGVYRVGAVLLDYHYPWRVRFYTPEPLIEPTVPSGDVENVVFPSGLLRRDSKLLLWCGINDKWVGVYELDESEVLSSFSSL